MVLKTSSAILMMAPLLLTFAFGETRSLPYSSTATAANQKLLAPTSEEPSTAPTMPPTLTLKAASSASDTSDTTVNQATSTELPASDVSETTVPQSTSAEPPTTVLPVIDSSADTTGLFENNTTTPTYSTTPLLLVSAQPFTQKNRTRFGEWADLSTTTASENKTTKPTDSGGFADFNYVRSMTKQIGQTGLFNFAFCLIIGLIIVMIIYTVFEQVLSRCRRCCLPSDWRNLNPMRSSISSYHSLMEQGTGRNNGRQAHRVDELPLTSDMDNDDDGEDDFFGMLNHQTTSFSKQQSGRKTF